MPEISIIVPVYNAEQYLETCVDSILAQTFADFELILVDDGSPDSSGAICDSYAARDARVRVIHQKNQGQSVARNNGIAQSLGEWICFVDSDDIVHPQLLEHLYKGVIQHGTRLSMCSHVEGESIPDTFFLHCNSSCSVMTMEEETWVSLYDADQYPCWVIWEKLIHRNIILKYPFCEGRVYEDNAIVCYWFQEAGTVAYIPHELYFYRVNPSGTTKSGFSMKKLDYLWALEEIIRFCRFAEMPRLQERFCSRYLKMAYSFRYQIDGLQEEKKIAKKIREDVHRFLKAEKIFLTADQRILLMDLYCPVLADARELVQVSLRKVREQGCVEFIRAAVRFLKRGGQV